MKIYPKKLIRFLNVHQRWSISLKILPLVIVIIGLKYIMFVLNLDRIVLNSLFTALISANIFIIGFLISGVLSDYKESEKLPSDLACSLESLADEGRILQYGGHGELANKYLSTISKLNENILQWFHKRYRTENLMQDISSLDEYFYKLEGITQPPSLTRLKNEQSSIRKMVNRINTIRETDFLGTGYAVAEIITTLLIIGMLFTEISQFLVENMVFTGFVSFILIYMIFLIKDLDNPFSYYIEHNISGNVSLTPIIKSNSRIQKML